ncbi:MAG: hypothetical protein HYX92_12810 [Chloroflexi bacterium]|nr:hypothetical protein [Chloroflexota bacterium]
MALVVFLAFSGPLTISAQQGPAPGLRPLSTDPFTPYWIRLAEPDSLIVADAPPDQLAIQARQHQRAQVGAALRKLAAAAVRDYSFDEHEGTPSENADLNEVEGFRARLTPSGRAALAANPLIAAVEEGPGPLGEGLRPSPKAAGVLDPSASGSIVPRSVSSIVFAQVYTPFLWGRTNIGGLAVSLTLEDSSGNVKGMAKQAFNAAPDNFVKIDRVQLYYETVFVDPNLSGHPPVNIMPGDRIHVVTSGDDPATPGIDSPEDKRIVVDDIRAWTSYERDSVSGAAPANSSLIVTVASSLLLSQYLTPGTSMTYAETTSGSDGSFSVSDFRTSTNATPKRSDLKQGSTGFVRLRHPDGNEVYTVHGQSVLILQNSRLVHGYAARLPTAPGPLEAGVTVTRPVPDVLVTLKNSAGQVKETLRSGLDFPYAWPYVATFPTATIYGGDVVEVTIGSAPSVQITAQSLTASVDLGANQVTGAGPANTQMVLGAGRINGYVAKNSTFNYIEKRVNSDSGGSYASGQFQCGTAGLLALRPGSFGYAGYEDARGNFVYVSFAAPANHVMSDYPFVEGWVANGGGRPEIVVRSPSSVKDGTVAVPLVLYMVNQRLYLNTYYQVMMSDYMEPGDTVTVVSGGQTYTIPVPRITAYVNPDADAVSGEAPAGATVKVIPADDRYARREVTVDPSGVFNAGNPFNYTNSGNCSETTKNEDFAPGDSGRVYLGLPDGSQVFAAYGRSIHVTQNENYVELYQFATRDIDWYPTPRRSATVTLTPKQGSPLSVSVKADYGQAGKTKVSLMDTGGQRVLIRPGDSLSVAFDEGPDEITRPVSLSFGSLPLVTGSPDLDAGTLAGVGPRGWAGRATLTTVSAAKPAAIPPGVSTAYAPLKFPGAASLVRGDAGTVSFTDSSGRRIWVAWAVTTYQVKIAGKLKAGDTSVCGKAPPGSTVRIRDATVETQEMVIGTGKADSSGDFCVTVLGPLYKDQVLLAEADGAYSQPVIVGSLILQLSAEWNLISVPTPQQDASLEALFAQTPAVTKAYTMQDGLWIFANRSPSGWSGPLTQIVDGKGYYIYATEPAALSLNSKAGGATAAPSYPLAAGWSLIGYTSSLATMPLDSYLASLAGKWLTLFRYDAANGWELAKPGGTGFTQVENGRGYWINLSADGTLAPGGP